MDGASLMTTFSFTDIPVVETESTILRSHRLSDSEAYAAM